MSAWRIIEGDCLTALRGMDDCSVDAVATDPPYSLAFMGSKWDSHPSPAAFQAWCQEWAAECLRVLRPGGHMLAFGGTRTHHRLICGIEDAGFEIRDTICWLYGTGFPKSHDVSKAIDRATGAERDREPYAGGIASGSNNYGGGGAVHVGTKVGPTAVTDAARAWDGWGTALKPAWEIVVVAAKPDPETERDAVNLSLCLLGNRIASLSPANTAVERSASSQAEHDAAVLASARWTADERARTRDALCAQTDTSRFESAVTTSLNIVSSWRRILAELCEPASTSITETASSTTTVLRTLKSCLSDLTPLTTIEALTSPDGRRFDALPAARAFAAVESNLTATRALSVLGRATGASPGGCRDGGGPSPAHEPIVLARKPLTGTVAANVQAHGTGALNIDATRIPANDKTPFPVGDYGDRGIYGAAGERADDPNPSGRWPANVCLDEEAAPRAMTARVPGAPGRPAWPRPFRTRGPTSMLARMANKAPLETDDAIVLVLGAPGGNEKAGWLEGVTRLEKLIFLLERETPVRDWMTEKADFHSWRFGPFSSKVYEAADTLAAAKLIRDSASIAHNAEDRWESLNALMDEQDVDPYTTRTFQLTDRGRRYYEAVLRDLPPNAEEILADFKRKFARLPLRQLVRYVYERYPQFTDD